MSVVLDEYQTAVVNSNERNIVVIAGAGSGKTRVLTERIRRILNEGVDPATIVAITFTKMAAEELVERLSDINGYEKMFVGTIHAFANKILSSTNLYYNILDDESEMYIMKDLCSIKNFPIRFEMYLDYKNQHYDSGKVYQYITRKYGFNKSKQLRHILEYDSNDEFPVTVKSYAKSHNYITFDELINLCSDYLEKNNIFIDYLFVDEFQDIGNLEYNFIKNLYADHCFVVGDDYQAIYGFKGATDIYFKQLLDSDKWYSIMLPNNYRCGEYIIKLGNSIISNIVENEPVKPAICKSGKKGDVKYIPNINSIVNIIKNNSNIQYSDWFILCRANKEVDNVILLLTDNNIPCTTFKKSMLDSNELDSLMKSNTVKVLTVHSAKGLENKNVIIAYRNPLYANWNYDDTGNIKKPEEIKLYYVAITRAIDNLYIL